MAVSVRYRSLVWIIAFGALIALAVVWQPESSDTQGSPGAEGGSTRYLEPENFDVFAVLPPPPAPGSPRAEEDRRIFRDTRAMLDSPRVQMATGDDSLDANSNLSHFACALQVDLKPEQVPRLAHLLQKATRDATRGIDAGKDRYRRLRPFKVDEGLACVSRRALGESFDYPSGHAGVGWAWGRVLSQVEPSRAGPLMDRGRAIGDSRVFCGVHNASSVEASRLVVDGAMTLIVANPRYQHDLQKAREEFQRVVADPATKHPDPQACRVEAALVAMPFPGVSGAGSRSASPAR